MHGSIDPRTLLRHELAQRAESGFDIAPVLGSLDRQGGLETVGPDVASDLLDELDHSVRDADYAYVEPDDLHGIRAECDWPSEGVPIELDADFSSAVHRAWVGRVAGNMLGKPVEGWSHEDIYALLERQGALPLRDYFPAPDTDVLRAQYVPCWTETTLGNVDGSSRDDDVDYTILNLHVLRSYGSEFTTGDVASTWLELLPYLQTYTAERAAIRNLVRGYSPEAAGAWRNPYREFIGAAIRADVFGFVCPGHTARAAELAYRDAYLSHRGNGIYAEMWCAALVAAAFTASSPSEALTRSLEVVPKRSRLYEAITDVQRAHAEGLTWDSVRDRIDETWSGYSWVHAVNNAALLAAGVLYGDGDFDQTIGLTVLGGLDTDSNGGTAGAVGGALVAEVPEHWSGPLRDLVRSAVFGYDGVSMSTLAAWTVEVATAVRQGDPTPALPRNPIPTNLW
jgi:ADP-ribosylglycohydrolase